MANSRTPQPKRRRRCSKQRRKVHRTAQQDAKKLEALQQNLMELVAQWHDANLAQERQKIWVARKQLERQPYKRSAQTDKAES